MRGCGYYARGRRVGATSVPVRVLRRPGISVTCVPLSPSFERAQKRKVVWSKIYRDNKHSMHILVETELITYLRRGVRSTLQLQHDQFKPDS